MSLHLNEIPTTLLLAAAGILLLSLFTISITLGAQKLEQRITEIAAAKTCLEADLPLATLHADKKMVTCTDPFGQYKAELLINYNTSVAYEMCMCCMNKTSLGNECYC